MPINIKHSFVDTILESQQSISSAPCALILGTATDGPVYEPVYVENVEAAINKFGSGELVKGAHEALLTKNTNIYLVRISGKQSTAKIFNQANQEVISLISLYAGSKYNRYYVIVDATTFKIGLTDENNAIILETEYLKSDYQNIEELVDAINRDSLMRRHLIVAESGDLQESLSNLKSVSQRFTGGTNEETMSSTKRHSQLQKAFEYLTGLPSRMTIVLPINMFFDSTDDAVYIDTINEWCQERSESGYSTIAVFGVQDCDYTNLINARRQDAKYCCVFVGRPRIPLGDLPASEANSENGTNYITDGAIIYGTLISSMKLPFSLTNAQFPCIEDTLPEWTGNELLGLEVRGITTLRKSVRRGHTISCAVTLAEDSSFKSLKAICTIGEMSALIREIVEPFIGEPNPIENTIGTEINKALEYLFNISAIRNYQINLFRKGHELLIEIDCVVVGEIQTIQTNLRFMFSNWR